MNEGSKVTTMAQAGSEATDKNSPQLMHLVMGGRVDDPRTMTFTNLEEVDLVGVFPDYESAENAWRAQAQRTVDDAEMKYVIVHLHKLLEPKMS